MYINRSASEKLIKLSNTFPVVVITGARQVGKSTLLEYLFRDKADIVVFDPVIDVEKEIGDVVDNWRLGTLLTICTNCIIAIMQ